MCCGISELNLQNICNCCIFAKIAEIERNVERLTLNAGGKFPKTEFSIPAWYNATFIMDVSR